MVFIFDYNWFNVSFTGNIGDTPTINYITYLSSYVEDGKINYSFKDEHISNYTNDCGEILTFWNYLKFKIKNTESTSNYKEMKISKTENLGVNYNKTTFYINCLGYIIGGVMIVFIFLSNSLYCDKCKKYMKEKNSYDFVYSDWDKEIKNLHFSLQGTNQQSYNFINMKIFMFQNNKSHIRSILTYRRLCKDVFINFRFM